MKELSYFLYNLLGDSQFLWNIYFILTTSIFLTIIYLILKKVKRINLIYIILIKLFYMILMWAPHMQRNYLNPDEIQWFVQAREFNYDPILWIKYFSVTNISRIGTILPLSIIDFVYPGDDSCVKLRMASLICYLSICIIAYKITHKIINNKNTSLIYSTVLCTMFANFQFFDFLAYNSEVICTILLLLICNKYIDFSSKSKINKNIIIISSLIFILPLCKEQCFPVSVLLSILIFFYIFYNIRTSLNLFIYYNITLSTAFFLILYISGNFQYFYDIFINTIDYAKNGLTESRDFKYKLIFLFNCLTREDFRSIFYPVTISIFYIILFKYKNLLKIIKNSYFELSIIFLLLIIISLIISLPGNPFPHYGVLFFTPFILLGIFILCSKYKILKILFLSSIVTISLAQPEKHEGVEELYLHNINIQPHSFVNYIRLNSEPNDRLVVWGWNNNLYIESDCLLGSRFLYPVYATTRWTKSANFLSYYLDDLIKFKPKFLISWMGSDTFYFNNSRYSPIKNFPLVKDHIDKNYKLVLNDGDKQLYVIVE